MQKNIHYIAFLICMFWAMTEATERSEPIVPEVAGNAVEQIIVPEVAGNAVEQTNCFACISGIYTLGCEFLKKATTGAAIGAVNGAATGATTGALVALVFLAGAHTGVIPGVMAGAIAGAKIGATNTIIADIMGYESNPALFGAISGSVAAAGFVADNITGCYLVRFPIEALVAGGIITITAVMSDAETEAINVATAATAIASLGNPVVGIISEHEAGPVVSNIAEILFPLGVITAAESLAGAEPQQRALVRAASGIVGGNNVIPIIMVLSS